MCPPVPEGKQHCSTNRFPAKQNTAQATAAQKNSAYILATTDRLRVCFTGKQAAALGVWTDLSPKGTEFAPQQTGFHPNMLPVCPWGQPELSKFTAPRQLCYADLVETNPSNTPGCAAASAELPSFLPQLTGKISVSRFQLSDPQPVKAGQPREISNRQQLLFSNPPKTLSQTTSFS